MSLFSKSKTGKGQNAACAVQTSMASNHPYYQLCSGAALGHQGKIYASLRESVPIIDAAVLKIVRLCNSFHFETGNEALDEEINDFFDGISVGGNQTGIEAFASTYLAQLLTYGTAVGEMLADENGLYGLYNGELDAIEVKRAKNNFDLEFYNGASRIENQELILFSALNPEPGKIYGVSLLQGLPFVSDILLKIYNTIGENWEHAGNLRYAVTYNPDGGAADSASARESAAQIASAWRDAMSSKDAVKDFVAVGDVSVKVIGADSTVLDSQIPVRQLLEQIVAKTGIPPFMLGLSWSTTERMSKQQADILTTELEAYRRILTPVLGKIAGKYLQLKARFENARIVWDDITLLDETESARARLYDAQAEKILRETAN